MQSINFSSFEKALSVGLGGFMFNSFLVSLFSVFLIVVISGMAAYVLARVDFKINKYVYLLIVAGFAIPPAAVLVPLYATVSNLGLLKMYSSGELSNVADGAPAKEKPEAGMLKMYSQGELSKVADGK